MTWFLETAAVTAVVGAASGALVPRIVARLPEPAPDVVDELVPAVDEAAYARPVDDPKELYADVAALPGLTWKCVAAGAVAGGLVGGRVGWSPALLFLLYLVPVGIALSVVDWRTRYLPIRLVRPSYAVVGVLVVLASALTSDWRSLEVAAIGSLSAYAFFFVMWLLPGGMAYGDVRLAGVLGMALGWLGPAQLILGLYTGFVLGGVVGLLLSRMKVFHHRHSPFGPHMLVGALLAVAFTPELGAAYGWVIAAIVGVLPG